jgi:hypothetical protein
MVSFKQSPEPTVAQKHQSYWEHLRFEGWGVIPTLASTLDRVTAELMSIASALGEVVRGRGGSLIERVVPEEEETARRGSLSSKYGLAPLPLHNDTAHWITPCRYIALACVSPGPRPTPTFLFDSQSAHLTERENLVCRASVFLIRNGRHSFYGSIKERNRPFVRVDPGCMAPLSDEGNEALRVFQMDRHVNNLHRHNWDAGEILVIDNWRILHGRGYEAPTERGRILLRAMIR